MDKVPGRTRDPLPSGPITPASTLQYVRTEKLSSAADWLGISVLRAEPMQASVMERAVVGFPWMSRASLA